jgi:crotonobetaine/carnitine-CoA ligase
VPRTIPQLFRAAVADAPDRTWLLTPDLELTYAQALARIERAATALRDLGIGPDDRVIVVARNTADHLLCWFALMEVGAIQVPVNPASSTEELAGFRHQVEPALVVDDENLPALFSSTADGRGPEVRDERDVAVMIPTSGTTGRSKLVMQTHLRGRASRSGCA